MPDDTRGQTTGSAACRVTTLVAEAIACCHRLASSSAVSSPPNAEYLGSVARPVATL
jgi:hypothetical protein